MVVLKVYPYFDKIKFIGMTIRGDEPDWQYVEAVDFEANEGRGNFTLTYDKAQAKRFVTEKEAHEFWRRRSKTVPTRPDGKPNRPLTAFHATFETVP